MILKKAIRNDKVIRCFNVIGKNEKKLGLTCNFRLLDRNSVGQVAGRIKCKKCGAIYEITNDYMYLVEIKTKHGG